MRIEYQEGTKRIVIEMAAGTKNEIVDIFEALMKRVFPEKQG